VCTSDEDCNKCAEIGDDIEMSCATIVENPHVSKTKKISVCLPKTVTLSNDCNENNGAIKVWSGWNNPERMEWDCVCTYPDWAGGSDYKGKTTCELNPDICQGGTWNYDATTATGPPTADNCTCDASDQHHIRELTKCSVLSDREKQECIDDINKIYPLYSDQKLVSIFGEYPICVPKDTTTTGLYKDLYKMPS
jgi:hypothetical protein